MNSVPFESLVKLQLGAATAAARSYEVGIIQRTPVPDSVAARELIHLALEAHNRQRGKDTVDETTHVFQLPGLAAQRDGSLAAVASELDRAKRETDERLAAVQAQIDDLAFDLYGIGEEDRAALTADVGQAEDSSNEAAADADSDESQEEAAAVEDLTVRVQNLLMWCVGVAFGRWDVRMALDPTLLPSLQGPFDPLPRCAPGALVGVDGLPPTRLEAIAPEAWLRSRKDVLDLPPAPQPTPAAAYPLEIAWDGILVDDENHPADLVGRVRQVLRLLWSERADAIEQEACAILGFPDLRSYFRDPRQGFYAFHIKRYTKSRRKAPIYWLLQSERRNYAIWLYYHRLRDLTLYEAARKPYADSKVLLEEARLEELRRDVAGLSGAARKQAERALDRQQKLVTEVTAFRDTLDRVAALNLAVDHNDGVIISIAPLHSLTPWKEAAAMWRELEAGKYEWSSMAQTMRKRGYVKIEVVSIMSFRGVCDEESLCAVRRAEGPFAFGSG